MSHSTWDAGTPAGRSSGYVWSRPVHEVASATLCGSRSSRSTAWIRYPTPPLSFLVWAQMPVSAICLPVWGKVHGVLGSRLGGWQGLAKIRAARRVISPVLAPPDLLGWSAETLRGDCLSNMKAGASFSQIDVLVRSVSGAIRHARPRGRANQVDGQYRKGPWEIQCSLIVTVMRLPECPAEAGTRVTRWSLLCGLGAVEALCVLSFFSIPPLPPGPCRSSQRD